MGATFRTASVTRANAALVPDQLVAQRDFLPKQNVLRSEPPLIQRAARRHEDVLTRQGLLDERERAVLTRLESCGRRPVPGDDRHGKITVHGRELPEHLQSIHTRHLDVEKHEVKHLARDQIDTILARGGLQAFVALVLEDHLQRVANRSFVVNHQNARLWHGHSIISLPKAASSSVGTPSVRALANLLPGSTPATT